MNASTLKQLNDLREENRNLKRLLKEEQDRSGRLAGKISLPGLVVDPACV